MQYLQLLDRSGLESLNSFAQSTELTQSIFLNAAFSLVYLVPLILLIFWFIPKGDLLKNKIAALQMFVSGAFAWQVINRLLSILVNRPRPAQNQYVDVQELIFHRPDKTFPSDHAAFLFAITTTLYLMGYRKLAHFMLFLSVLISISRVATALHYPTDILAGIGVGVFSAALFYRFLPYLTQHIYTPVINLAKKLKLAKI